MVAVPDCGPLHKYAAQDYYLGACCKHAVMSVWARRGVEGSTDLLVLKPLDAVVGSTREPGLEVGARRHRWSQSARPSKRSGLPLTHPGDGPGGERCVLSESGRSPAYFGFCHLLCDQQTSAMLEESAIRTICALHAACLRAVMGQTSCRQSRTIGFRHASSRCRKQNQEFARSM